MLERYEENFEKERFLRTMMNRKGINRTMALQICRKEIPKESYFQDKIRRGIKRRYASAFIRKVTQGLYSEGGTPDLMCIIDGHYFGFEVKRPIVGEVTRLQELAMREIEAAGGTAAVVTWPEECYAIINAWRSENRN